MYALPTRPADAPLATEPVTNCVLVTLRDIDPLVPAFVALLRTFAAVARLAPSISVSLSVVPFAATPTSMVQAPVVNVVTSKCTLWTRIAAPAGFAQANTPPAVSTAASATFVTRGTPTVAVAAIVIVPLTVSVPSTTHDEPPCSW